MANIADFNAGSGMGDSAAADFTNLFFGISVILTAAWAMWVFYKTYRAWAGGRLEPHETVSVATTALVVLTVVVSLFTIS